MEKHDRELIEKYVSANDELNKNVREHTRLESILEDFNKQAHLTIEEELEQKRIKKLKLKSRDKIEKILSKYRRNK